MKTYNTPLFLPNTISVLGKPSDDTFLALKKGGYYIVYNYTDAFQTIHDVVMQWDFRTGAFGPTIADVNIGPGNMLAPVHSFRVGNGSSDATVQVFRTTTT